MQPARLLMLGCGSVAQCTIPILLREAVVEPQRITILDMVDNRARVEEAIAAGVNYVQDRITEENLDEVLSRHVAAGDIIIDLAWNIDACTILQWCRDHGVRYLNTSVELWDPYAGAGSLHPLDRTLYVRHMAIRRMMARWGDNDGPTAVLEHGANPGLVSHFVKQALVEIATKSLAEDRIVVGRPVVEDCLAGERYNELARALGVKVVHIAERDTQISNVPKQVNEFVNTWSVEGFYEEGIAPAELGWGTHEKQMPLGAYQHAGEGPGNQICLPQPGCKTWVRSWVPCGEITGMVVRHGEAFTMSEHLTVWDGPSPVYRPTVHYAYCPAADAVASMHELEMRHFDLQSDQRILNDEIVSGRDELGVLVMGHPYKAWWMGSLLSIEEARALVPHQNATTMQVAASVLAATKWMIDEPNRGVRVPDELPWQYVMKHAGPYLGTMFSGPADWDPLATRVRLFDGYDGRAFDQDDPWQFSNFLV
ncbi:MAG: homospermidine synthase [Acidimicrobiia bacterium]|nr:homospermidine synthase [Acidimicrobiia bacterium]